MKFYKKKIAKSKTITLQQLYGIQTDKKTITERTKVGSDDNTIYQLAEEVRRLQEWKEDF
jgi:hypothetical protein